MLGHGDTLPCTAGLVKGPLGVDPHRQRQSIANGLGLGDFGLGHGRLGGDTLPTVKVDLHHGTHGIIVLGVIKVFRVNLIIALQRHSGKMARSSARNALFSYGLLKFELLQIRPLT